MGNKNVPATKMQQGRSYDDDNTISELSTVITSRHGKTASCMNCRVSSSCLTPYASSVNASSANLSSMYLTPFNASASALPTDSRTTSTNCSSKSNLNPKGRRRSSLLNVHNGITGKFISSRICKIAAIFWKKNIDSLSVSDQLEISCSIFFGMMSTSNKMRSLMKSNISSDNTIETTSLKYLEMLGWLIRHLATDNIDLYSLLYKLGGFHQQMGITINHFTPLLKAMHDTFAYYFEDKYNIEIKYTMDEIFTLAAQIMTGEDLKCSSHLTHITKQFQGDIPFLQNLTVCLQLSVGKEYLYRYLSQTWCDEIVIFLKSVNRFKHLMTDKERFFVARAIAKHSIHPSATFTLNLSYETRTNTLHYIAELEAKFAAQQTIEVSTMFFNEVEREILKLIMDNHWCKFVENIQTLQSKSLEIQ